MPPMPSPKKLLRLVAALALCLALAAPAAAQPQRHKLPNGLTVITAENHEAPVVAFQVWVGAGSAYERPGEYGITHLIEHMIFKGTPKHPAGQMAKEIEALGGVVNAYTTLDHTNYYAATASENAGPALELLADAVVNASFAPAELAREKEVVVEEIRMGQDDPARRRSKEVMRLAFGEDHPYGRPVIGTKESVRAISRDDILAYKARWYRAPNMIVVAVGDFDTAQLLPKIEAAFAGLSPEPAQALEVPPPAGRAGPVLSVLREDVRQATVTMFWRIPGLPSPQVFPLDVAAAVAGEGETSRLWASLKEKRGLVDSVGAYAYTPRGAGLLEVEASMAPAKVMEAWPELLRTTLTLASEPPRPTELARARVNLSASFIRGRATMAGQARTLGYFEMMRGGFEQAQTYIERFSAVDAAQVAATARQHLRPQLLGAVIQLPEDAEAPAWEAFAGLAKEAWRATAAAEAAPGQPQGVTAVTLDNGLELLVKPQHSVPLVGLVLAAPGGSSADAPDQAGLASLWSAAVARGARGLPYQELTAELEGMAASLEGFSGRTTCGLTGNFLSRDWRRGLELLSLVWRRPAFAPEQVERAKAEQLAALRQQQDSPVARAIKAARKLLFGDHPYGRDPLGEPATVAKLGPEQLRALHERMQGPGGVVLAVVGDVDPAQVEAEARRLFAGLAGRAQGEAPPPVQPPSQPRREDLADADAKQTQIIMGFAAPGATDPQRHAMELIQDVLGGMGGRLFLDLRERRSLAYAVQPFYSDWATGGMFGLYMGVGPGKEQEAVAGLARHLAALRDAPPSAAEMDRAKAYLLGQRAIGLQTYDAQAMAMAMGQLLGLGWDNYLREPAAIKAVTPADIQAAARRWLGQGHRALLTLGPPPAKAGPEAKAQAD